MVQITKTLGVAALVAGMAMGSSMVEGNDIEIMNSPETYGFESDKTNEQNRLYENELKKDLNNSNTDSPMEDDNEVEESTEHPQYDEMMDFLRNFNFEDTLTETKDDVEGETDEVEQDDLIFAIYEIEDDLFEDIDMVLEEEVIEEIAQGVENFIQDVVENIPKEVSEQMKDIGNDFEALFGKLEESKPKNFEEVIENIKTAEEFEEYAAKVQEELPEETKEQIKAFEEKTTKFFEEGLKMVEELFNTAEDNTEDKAEETVEDNVDATVEETPEVEQTDNNRDYLKNLKTFPEHKQPNFPTEVKQTQSE
jgi:cation transport regulator ChaB